LETITLCSIDDTRSTSGTHVANRYTFPRSVPLLSLSLPLACRDTACSPLAEVWPPPVAPASALSSSIRGANILESPLPVILLYVSRANASVAVINLAKVHVPGIRMAEPGHYCTCTMRRT